MISAFSRSTSSPAISLITSSNSTRFSASVISTFSLITGMSFTSPGSLFLNTPGLTVPSCGLWSGHIIVAIRFPPNAGLVHAMLPVSSSISNAVQSAVKPVPSLQEIRGPMSLPLFVAPISITDGPYFSINSQRTFA